MEKNLGILTDEVLDTSKQGMLVAHCILGCTKKYVVSRSRQVTLPLFFGLVRPYLEYCIHLWGPQHKTWTC